MMDTEMQRSTEVDLARVNGRNDLQAFLDERTRRIPLGRRAEISEVAEAVVWLGARCAALHDRRTAQHVRRARQGLIRCCEILLPAMPISARSNARRRTCAATCSPWRAARGRAISARASASPMCWRRSTSTSCATTRQSRLGRARPLPAVDRPLFDRAVGGAGRGRHHSGRGTRHLRRRRQPAGDVDARHHARRRDDRRLARPWPRARRRPGARACASTDPTRASSSNCRTARCRRARPGRRRCRPAISSSTGWWR